MNLRVRLSRTPPQEWRDAFNYPAGYVPLGEGMKLSGETVNVTIESSEQALDALKQIDNRVESTNAHFERDVLPGLRAREENKHRDAQAKAERLTAVRDALKGK